MVKRRRGGSRRGDINKDREFVTLVNNVLYPHGILLLYTVSLNCQLIF